MKIIYFVSNGTMDEQDHASVVKLRGEGNKVILANGSPTIGFKDSCDAVVMSADFPHIREWAESEGINIIDMNPVATSESTADAETEAPKPRRGRKPKSETE